VPDGGAAFGDREGCDHGAGGLLYRCPHAELDGVRASTPDERLNRLIHVQARCCQLEVQPLAVSYGQLKALERPPDCSGIELGRKRAGAVSLEGGVHERLDQRSLAG
jgi:hypothetical protein